MAMGTLTSFLHRKMTTPLPGTRTTALPTLRGRHPIFPPPQMALSRFLLLTWTVTETLTSFLHRKMTTLLHGMRTTALPTLRGRHPIFLPLRKALYQCMLPIWMQMATSISFQHPTWTTPLRGSRTMALPTLRGRHPTFPLHSYKVADKISKASTGHGRYLLPTLMVTEILTSFQRLTTTNGIFSSIIKQELGFGTT